MSARLLPLIASAALLAATAGANAQTATATTDVNVRSGPGSDYEVIDQLPAGEVVRVLDCRGDWCEISMGGDSGYVARSYLDDGGRRARVRVYQEEDDGGPFVIERDDPDEIYGLSIGGYYERRPFYIRGGYYYWGGRWYARRPGAAGWRESWRRGGGRDRPGHVRDGRDNRPPRAEERFKPMERARVDRDGPGDTRDGRTNRPPRVDERIVPQERGRAGRDDGGDRRGREGGSTVSVDPRGPSGREGAGRSEPRREAAEPRRDEGPTVASPAERRGPSDGGGRTPGGASSDRGDRIGLDRAGGGGGTGRGDR